MKGIIHCSGGAQAKCLKFGSGIHFVKDSLFPVPPVFESIQKASGTDWQEMYKVFNMGHRMEVYVEPSRVDEVVDVARSYGVAAQQIGFTEAVSENRLTLTDCNGNRQRYRP